MPDVKAAVIESFEGPVKFAAVPDPDCPRDGIVVRVMACGVCRSDWHLWRGSDAGTVLPHIMGHEFAGIVVEVGPDCNGFEVGDRVTAPFILGCGTCADCTSGQPTVCSDQALIGFTLPGAFAGLLGVPRADFNVVRLPHALGYADAAGIGCRIKTALQALTDRADTRLGEWVAVFGCGGVGLSAVMIAAALGARVVAVDVKPDALIHARRLGAEHVLNAAEVQDVPDAIRRFTDGGAHVSIEALGMTETFRNSLRSLRGLGRHVQIGMPTGPHATVELPLLDLVYSRQLTILGTRGIAAAGFGPLFDMIDAGLLPLDDLVSQKIPLSQVGRAVADLGRFSSSGVTIVNRFDR